MADKNYTITVDLLKKLFEYKDGKLYWLNPKHKAKIGKEAGTLRPDGYRQVTINYKTILAHRIIFMMHHGFMPNFVDHIDCNKFNNKVENLRNSTVMQNSQNQKASKKNTSGIKGVVWSKKSNKWQAQIKLNYKNKHIGLFESIKDAEKAIKKAREELHGIFANHG